MEILDNTHVCTLEGSQPLASAIAIIRERIMLIGDLEQPLSVFHCIEKREIKGCILPRQYWTARGYGKSRKTWLNQND